MIDVGDENDVRLIKRYMKKQFGEEGVQDDGDLAYYMTVDEVEE